MVAVASDIKLFVLWWLWPLFLMTGFWLFWLFLEHGVDATIGCDREIFVERSKV